MNGLSRLVLVGLPRPYLVEPLLHVWDSLSEGWGSSGAPFFPVTQHQSITASVLIRTDSSIVSTLSTFLVVLGSAVTDVPPRGTIWRTAS